MKLDDAEAIAKQEIKAFAQPHRDLIQANEDRFVLHSWKGDDAWYISVSVFPAAAMDAKTGFDQEQDRSMDWLLVRVAADGQSQIEEVQELQKLLKI